MLALNPQFIEFLKHNSPEFLERLKELEQTNPEFINLLNNSNAYAEIRIRQLEARFREEEERAERELQERVERELSEQYAYDCLEDYPIGRKALQAWYANYITRMDSMKKE